MADVHPDIAYLEAIVPVMRRLGVLEHGSTKLGADPLATNDNPAKQPTANEVNVNARAERARVMRLSSGGPGLPRERIG